MPALATRGAVVAEAVAGGAPVHVVSGVTGAGLEVLAAQALAPARTLALLGSSGAGKSTLVNRLAGAAYATAPLGTDGRGRHTTTRRALVPLPSGAVLLDTPGMRELRLWDDDDDALDATFADVARFADACRFRDCAHGGEPGCAVRRAVEDGALDASRFASWEKLEREAAATARRKDARAGAEEKRRMKVLSRAVRAYERARR